MDPPMKGKLIRSPEKIGSVGAWGRGRLEEWVRREGEGRREENMRELDGQDGGRTEEEQGKTYLD